jgi:hypothetical protein
MSIKLGVAVASLCALVGLTGVASAEMFAPSKAAKPKVVTVTGCATQGVPQFCTRMGRFNVTGANPAVPIGKRAMVRGTETGNPSVCSGVTLEKITWKLAGGKCPPTKGEK